MRVSRRIRIERDVILDANAFAVWLVIAADVLVERNRIEGVAHVDPPAHVGWHEQLYRFRQVPDEVLDFVDAERRADGYEQRNVEVSELRLHEDSVGDHRPLTVGDDDERSAAGLQPLPK